MISLDLKKSSEVRKAVDPSKYPCFHLRPSVVMIWTSSGMAYVLIMYPAEKNDVVIEAYIAFIAFIVFLLRTVIPQIVFYFLYIVELQNLINWVQNLKCKIQSEELFETSFNQYLIALKAADDLFSFNSFIFIFCQSISVICCSYRGFISGK